MRLPLFGVMAVGLFLVVWFGLQKAIAPSQPLAGVSALLDLSIWRWPNLLMAIIPLCAGLGTGAIIYLRSR